MLNNARPGAVWRYTARFHLAAPCPAASAWFLWRSGPSAYHRGLGRDAKRTTLLLWSAALSAIALAGVGLVNSFWPAVVLFLISMAAQGVGTPIR